MQSFETCFKRIGAHFWKKLFFHPRVPPLVFGLPVCHILAEGGAKFENKWGTNKIKSVSTCIRNIHIYACGAWYFEVLLPLKVVFYESCPPLKLSSIDVCIPSKVIFPQMVSFIKSCLPLKWWQCQYFGGETPPPFPNVLTQYLNVTRLSTYRSILPAGKISPWFLNWIHSLPVTLFKIGIRKGKVYLWD